MKLTYTITGLSGVLANIGHMSDRIRQEVLVQMKPTMEGVVTYVQLNKLSGQVLNVKTGATRDALDSRAFEDGANVVGEAFIPLNKAPGARMNEYGGRTRPHVIVPRTAKALKFLASDGEDVFARRVNHPGSQMPERSFMRSGLNDMTAKIIEELQEAANRAVNK